VLLDKLHDSFSQIQQSDIQTQEMLRKFQKNPFNINAYSYFKNDILSKIGRLVAQGKIDETKSVIEEGQKLLSRSHRRMKFLLLQLAYYYHRKGQLNEGIATTSLHRLTLSFYRLMSVTNVNFLLFFAE
jgi:hypothetical protein